MNRLTESELAALAPLIFAASIIIAAWFGGRAALGVDPLFILATGLLATAGALAAIARWHGHWQVSYSARRLFGFLIVLIGFTVYVCWLVWPTLLPLTEGPDLVHHLTLVHFIQRHHALVQDPALGKYLGEMASYTPGSHLLAALAAEWLRVDGLRVLHPLQAIAIGVKAATLFNTFTRLLSPYGSNVAASLGGTALLLLPFQYLLDPVIRFGFYSQVLAETFAVAILWTMVVWYRSSSRAMLMLAAMFMVAVALCWPVYVPACALAVALVMLVRRAPTIRWTRRVILDPLLVLGPGAVVLSTFFAAEGRSASILRSGGSVLVPSVELFGWMYLLLAAVGSGIAVSRAGTYAAALAFATACLAQIAALAVLQTLLGATNLYLANKTVFLLVYPATILGGVGSNAIWWKLGGIAPSPVRGRLAAALPALVLCVVAFRHVPSRPLTPPFSDSLQRAGEWARTNVPTACVDYFVEPWVTGYWLHLDVLGNPRAAERMRTETFEYRVAVSRWILPGGPPFAIVGDLAAVPADARRNMDVMQQFGSAAVVRRADGLGECRDVSPSIYEVERRERR